MLQFECPPRKRIARPWFAPMVALALLAGCDNDEFSYQWRDLGEVPAQATTRLNHTPMVVSGGRVLVGTADGIWSRPLDDSGDWTAAGLAGIGVFATRRHPMLEATLFAAGWPTADPEAPPFYRSDDGGANWVPAASFPVNPLVRISEPFFDLAVAPDAPDRLYANLSGPSVAISTDGGLNWALANGEAEVFFGYPCVLHVLDSTPASLFQGCEAPLDIAWVATQDIDPSNPFTLSNFTYVAGGPDLAIDNRRPNAMASGPARPGTLYVGLEGALIAIDDSGFDFVFRAGEGSSELPYVYVTGIWLDPDDPDHLIFGGGVNGENTELSLFETRDHGATIDAVDPPPALEDPAVEQILAVDGGLLVLVSEPNLPGADARRLHLYLLVGPTN
jgi:hypothetical protein